MQEISIFWLRVAALFYSVGLLYSLVAVLRRETPVLFRAALGAFAVGVVLHLVAFVDLWRQVQHFPADNFYESVSLCALLIAVLFLFVYWRYRFASAGLVVFPLTFLMTLLAALEIPIASWSSAGVRNAWLALHVLLVLGGYAALLMTAAASVFYLLQERQLKNKTRGGLFAHLPPLGTLDGLISQSMGVGFVLITLAVIVGSVWAFIEYGTRWIADAKIAISLLTWAFYLLMVFLRASAGWRGRKAAIMALAVLGCSALTWAAHVGLRSALIR